MEKKEQESNIPLPAADKDGGFSLRSDGRPKSSDEDAADAKPKIFSESEFYSLESREDPVGVNIQKIKTKKCETKTEDVSGVALSDKRKKEDKRTDKKKNDVQRKKRNMWTIKITIVSLLLAAFISFLSELTASSEHIIVTILLLLFLILCSILFDGIGISVTSCDITPIMSMASKKVYGAKTAMWLLKNNEKVASVCNDVIGDIFGIISGACSAAIVLKIVTLLDSDWQRWLTIIISSVVSAVTIGGKAFMKTIAINNSKEFVMFVSRIVAVFNPEERKIKRKEAVRKKQEKAAILADKNLKKTNDDVEDSDKCSNKDAVSAGKNKTKPLNQDINSSETEKKNKH